MERGKTQENETQRTGMLTNIYTTYIKGLMADDEL
jgi:hypothetical protein